MKLVTVLFVLLVSAVGFAIESKQSCPQAQYRCGFDFGGVPGFKLGSSEDYLYFYINTTQGNESVCVSDEENSAELEDAVIKTLKCPHCYDYSAVSRSDDDDYEITVEGTIRSEGKKIVGTLYLKDNKGNERELPSGTCTFKK